MILAAVRTSNPTNIEEFTVSELILNLNQSHLMNLRATSKLNLTKVFWQYLLCIAEQNNILLLKRILGSPA
jgi:hypothetical protein